MDSDNRAGAEPRRTSSQTHQALAGALLCSWSPPRSKPPLHPKGPRSPIVTRTVTTFLAAQHGTSRSSITVPTPGTECCETWVCWRLNFTSKQPKRGNTPDVGQTAAAAAQHSQSPVTWLSSRCRGAGIAPGADAAVLPSAPERCCPLDVTALYQLPSAGGTGELVCQDRQVSGKHPEAHVWKTPLV